MKPLSWDYIATLVVTPTFELDPDFPLGSGRLWRAAMEAKHGLLTELFVLEDPSSGDAWPWAVSIGRQGKEFFFEEGESFDFHAACDAALSCGMKATGRLVRSMPSEAWLEKFRRMRK